MQASNDEYDQYAIENWMEPYWYACKNNVKSYVLKKT